MKRLPLRRLVLGPPPPPDRIFFYSVWFRGHNNAIFAALLPRLPRLDRYLVVCSAKRPLRGLQYRAFRHARPLHHPVVLGAASRRYRHLFTGDNEQIPHFRGAVVSLVDDPTFSPREVELLRRPNLAAFVVTKERAGRRLRDLGVTAPYHVISQGLERRALTDEAIAAAAARREPGTIVVGYHASFLLTGDDPLFGADHLLDLWEEIRARVPEARLWLVGEADVRLRERLRGRTDIVLFGRLPAVETLAHAANFDVALYPRRDDVGVQAAKVVEYLGLGRPIVSYDLEVTDELRENGAALLARTPREFANAVERLARDEALRAELGARAAAAGARLDWDELAAEYRELLDRYLA